MTAESAALQEIARLSAVVDELVRIHAVKLDLVQIRGLTETARAATLGAAEADHGVFLAVLFPYSSMSYDLEVHCLRSQWKNLAGSKEGHPADFQSDVSEKQQTVLQGRAGHALSLSEGGRVA